VALKFSSPFPTHLHDQFPVIVFLRNKVSYHCCQDTYNNHQAGKIIIQSFKRLSQVTGEPEHHNKIWLLVIILRLCITKENPALNLPYFIRSQLIDGGCLHPKQALIETRALR
jgi:hypothetical protein